jgi:hypothetical protein
MQVHFRLSENDDPEERLEEAALWKAVHDEFGDGASLLGKDARECPNGLMIGRGFKTEWHEKVWRGVTGPYDYWNDPEFLSRARRSFKLCDLSEARTEVERLHSIGKGAFVKAVQQKYMNLPVPVGADFDVELDALVFSFCDAGRCLMVQEFAEFRYERRYLVINREVVTSSPVAWHLTPIDAYAQDLHYETPRARDGIFDAGMLIDFDVFADEAAKALAAPSTCLDLAMINGEVGIVELNPMHLGNVGLYACDVRAIARAIRTFPSPQQQEMK